MIYVLASATYKGKVVDTRILHTKEEITVYRHECRYRKYHAEFKEIPLPTLPKAPTPKHEPQYIPPPSWGGRVVCIETGWIFTSIATAASYMHGSQWALRKAVVRNTIYHNYHWRMYTDIPKTITKFT